MKWTTAAARAIELFAGDAAVIGRHVDQFDYDPLRQLRASDGHVDLGHRFTLDHLDLLTQEINDTIGCSCPDFSRCLRGPVGGDGLVHAAFAVAPLCVDLLGTIADSGTVIDWADAWARSAADAHFEPTFAATAETRALLRDFARLCDLAGSRGRDVVLVWHL